MLPNCRKWLLHSACVLLTGCSSLGDLQLLNDLGTSGRAVGATLRTIDSSCKVLTGHSCDQSNNSAQLNRNYGQVKQMPYYRNTPIPTIISEMSQLP